jgi:hypothetical protein
MKKSDTPGLEAPPDSGDLRAMPSRLAPPKDPLDGFEDGSRIRAGQNSSGYRRNLIWKLTLPPRPSFMLAWNNVLMAMI